jgi:hypothetical protein
MSNTEFILSKYLTMKGFRHPLSGKPFSKQERVYQLTSILTDSHYSNTFSKDDKLLANHIIELILNED